MIKYLNGTKKKYLTLSADDLKVVKWYVDEIFSVHPDFRIYTIEIMTMRQGAMHSVSWKQKLNTRIITQAELLAVDYESVYILWKMLFIEWKG